MPGAFLCTVSWYVLSFGISVYVSDFNGFSVYGGVGVLTGVGGGMIRDMMAGTMPYIFVKHIYAVASLAGGLLFALIYPYLPRLGSMMTGAVFVMLLRYFAARYRWNLPRIR